MLSIRNLVKIYKPKKAEPVKALNNVSIDFAETGLVFLLGKSGSGKSTLLNTIGGLDKFDGGEIIIKGKSSKDFSTTDFDSYRNTFIGFIFQDYNILEEFTVAKNLALAVELQGKKPDKEEIDNLLAQVDMLEYAKRKPNQLSGGQKQRIAIARALIKNPEIIMADEPTGALDSATGKQVMETLKKLSKNKLVIIVSHDREFAEEYGDRIIELKDGKIIKDVTKKEIVAKETNGIKVIDDNLIIIKKGQSITKDNFKIIEDAIKKNVDKEDIIISLDKSSNEKIRSVSSINNDGNKEGFTKTTEEDIKLKDYGKKDLHLIKSRFKNKDAFKMGASSLKYKKGKLFFTILLSLVAFVLFGVVDTFSCFNVSKSTCDTLSMICPEVVSVTKAHYNKYKLELDDLDLTKLKAKTNQNFYPVKTIGRGYSWTIDNTYGNSRNPMFDIGISGVMTLTQDIANDLNTPLLVGNYPVNKGEAVITKHLFECFERSNNNDDGFTPSTNYSSILNKKISNAGREYKIVGILDDKVDFSSYNSDGGEGIGYMLNYEEARKLGEYGFSKVLFVCDDDFNSVTTESENEFYLVGDGLSEFSYLSSNFIEFKTYYKEGYNINSVLGNNQIKISYDILKQLKYSGNATEFLLGDSKLKFTQRDYGSGDETTIEYEVVAVTTYNQPSNNMPIIFTRDISNISSYIELLDGSGNKEYISCNSMAIDKVGEITGISFKNNFNGILKDNQIIISKNTLTDNFQYTGSTDDFLQRNTKVKFYYDYFHKYYFNEIEIVGIAEYGDSRTVYSAEDGSIFKKGDYSFAVTKAGSSGVITHLDSAFNSLTNNNLGFRFEDKSMVTIENFGGIIEEITAPLLYVSIGLALFSALFLSNFISTSISYKKREIGVLRAIGAKSWDVFKIFFYESLLISGITYVLSVIGTVVTCFIVNNSIVGGMGLKIVLLSFGIRQIALMFLITLLISIIATFLPVRKIAKKNPIDAINNR